MNPLPFLVKAFLDIVNLLLVAVLIALTAFFVASEFAVVKIRSSRLDQLLAEGNKNAIAAKKITTNLDEYLSACQLGITVTALGIGWLGEPTFEKMLHPLFERLQLDDALITILSFGIAFGIITFLHVVVGELAPKTLAIQKAEAVTLAFARPLILFYRIMYPFIWILNGSARFLSGLFGLKPASEHEVAHSEEELRIILSESFESGEINQSEFKYVNKIFEFDDRIAKEIMNPRPEIVSISKDAKLQEVMGIIIEEKYTRYPIEDGDKDNIIGLINMKEVLTASFSDNFDPEQTVKVFIKPIIHVIETIPIHDLLLKMQKDRIHMAILSDEYGGTAGLVTVEDILEEIVGDIRDEFDIDEISEIRKINDQHYILDGKVLIDEVNDLLGIDLSNDVMDTIGGWILDQKFEVEIGDSVEEQGYVFTIKELDGKHILYLDVEKAPVVVEAAEGEK